MMQNKLILPKTCYGSLCLKILTDFIEYHDLDKSLELPKHDDLSHIMLEKIFNIMIQTMDEETREDILKQAQEYNMSLPSCIRNGNPS